MKRRDQRALFTATLGGAVAVLASQHAGAQEALTASRNAYQSAQARSRTLQDGGYAHAGQSLNYNLGAGISFTFNDNVNLSDTNPEDDFSIRPRVSAGLTWAATDYTRFGLDMGLGYSYYVNESRRSGLDFNVSPSADNDIGFEVLLGDWHLNFYDSFGVTSDPLQDGTISNEDELARFNNTVGVIASYTLDNSQIYSGYAFKTSLFQDSRYSDSDHGSHLFHAGYQYSFNPAFTVGMNTSASMSKYRSGNQNDTVAYTVGPTLFWLPTEFISISAGGGPAWITYSANNAGLKPEDRNTYYLYSTINHRFSEFASHSLSVNQSVSPAAQSSDNETLSFQYNLELRIIREVSLNLGAFYETGDYSSGIGGTQTRQSYDRVGASIRASRSLGENLSATLGYQFTHRDSDTPNGDYSQNRVTLSASYSF